MHKMRQSLNVILFLLLASCGKEPQPKAKPSLISIEASMAAAEAGARRVHLPEKLVEAGTNTRKLVSVYHDAVSLHESDIQKRADDKLIATVIPGAELATQEKTFINLLKDAPEGSRYRARLIELFKALNKKQCSTS